MRLPARLFALCLMMLVMPNLTEAAENVWHLLSTGHDAHAVEAGADHAPEGDEHGCSGTSHLCACCHTAPVDSAPRLTVRVVDAPEQGAPRTIPVGHTSPFLSSLDRPPRA
jgi:cytochrome c5